MRRLGLAPAGDPAERGGQRVAHRPERDAVADVGRLPPLAIPFTELAVLITIRELFAVSLP